MGLCFESFVDEPHAEVQYRGDEEFLHGSGDGLGFEADHTEGPIVQSDGSDDAEQADVNEMPESGHPFVAELSEVVGSDEIYRYGSTEFDHVPDLSGDVVGVDPVGEEQIEQRVEEDDADESADPFVPIVFIQHDQALW